MGHMRIGFLPKTRKWKQVIELLGATTSSNEKIAYATITASEEFFNQNKDNSVVVFCYWFLTQITSHARKKEVFINELNRFGLNINNLKNAINFLSSVSKYIDKQTQIRKGNYVLSKIAILSLKEVLSETIESQSQSLFGKSFEDIRIACKKYSDPKKFSKLSRLYFSKLLYRILQFFLSRETCNNVGRNRKFKDITELINFNSAIKLYCFQVSKIVEDFSSGWYSKHIWEGEITEEDTKKFVVIAIKKLQSEILRETNIVENN
jgi:hypothetical protein